jgi:autotransporter adhesin
VGTDVGSTVVGAGAAASGDNATAVGANAAATGANSTAIGSGSQVANANSLVALGVLQANNYTDQRFNEMNSTIDSIAKKSYSGSAAAIATANLPQAPAAGKSIVSVAGGTYAGQSAVAVGLSTVTRNGKWIIKASGSTTTSGTFAAGVGAGFVF